MDISSAKIWDQTMPKQLSRTLVSIRDVKTMQNFLRDVMTEKEIIEISARLEAASMLQKGSRYSDIIKKTKLSSRTVARISNWLQNGYGGYQAALDTQHHTLEPRLRAV